MYTNYLSLLNTVVSLLMELSSYPFHIMWVDTVLQASAIILFLNDILALFPDLLVCKNEFCMDIQTSQELLQCTA